MEEEREHEEEEEEGEDGSLGVIVTVIGIIYQPLSKTSDLPLLPQLMLLQHLLDY